MFRVKEVFPELDVGSYWMVVQDADARLFLVDLCALTGEVHLRRLDEPRKEVRLDLATSDRLRWKFFEALGDCGRRPCPCHPDTEGIPGTETIPRMDVRPPRRAGPET
jgi:hypothetical protein